MSLPIDTMTHTLYPQIIKTHLAELLELGIGWNIKDKVESEACPQEIQWMAL